MPRGLDSFFSPFSHNYHTVEDECVGHVDKILRRRPLQDSSAAADSTNDQPENYEYYVKWVRQDGGEPVHLWLRGDSLLPDELELYNPPSVC